MLMKVADSAPFGIYEMAEVEIVEPLGVEPSVYVPPAGEAEVDDFNAFALDWYGTIDALDHIVVTEGPWPQVSHVEDLVDRPTGAEEDAVSDVVVTDSEVSFTTQAVGLPHLVKVSFFPNWTVEGAEGPYRATPSLMVVVPTEDHVVLRFRNTWAENAGNILTLVGLGGLAWYGVRRRRGLATSATF